MNCPKCGEDINEAKIMAEKRNSKLSSEKRSDIAKKAAKARWDKAQNVPNAQNGPISNLS